MKTKTFVLAFIIGLFAVAVWADAGFIGEPSTSGVPVSGGGDLTWDDITFFLNFEANDTTGDYDMNTTPGTACEYANSGDTSGEYTGSGTIANVGTVGSYSFQADADNEYMTFVPTNGTEVSGTISSAGFWFRMNNTTWSSGTTIFRARNSTGNYHGILVTTSASGELTLRIYNGSNHDYTSSGLGLTIGTWYFISVSWDYTSDSYTLYVNGAEEVSTLDTYDAFSATQINVGCIGSANGRTWETDSLILSNTAEDLYAYRNATGYNN